MQLVLFPIAVASFIAIALLIAPALIYIWLEERVTLKKFDTKKVNDKA